VTLAPEAGEAPEPSLVIFLKTFPLEPGSSVNIRFLIYK
jgi:hypothetical protein